MSTPKSHRDIPPPHLTTVELAQRWRCRRETISREYRGWGLHPIRIAKALLFPIKQIEAIERQRMVGGEIEAEPKPAIKARETKAKPAALHLTKPRKRRN